MRTIRAVAGLMLACGLSGCGDDEDRSRGPGAITVGGGESVLVVGSTGLELSRGDQVLVTIPLDGFVLGRVAELDDLANYDPYPMAAGEQTAVIPEGLEWLPAKKASVARDGEAVVARLDHGGGVRSVVTVSADADGRFSFSFVPESDPDQHPVAYLQLRPVVTDSEAFYGLGEYFDAVDNRGFVRAMQIEPTGELESSYNEAHVPIPFFTSSRGWGLFVENPYPAAFDMAKAEPTRTEITFGTGLFSKDGLRTHLYAAAHPLDVTKHYYETTGYPRLPARWALGPWVWRDENEDQAQVEADLDAIRDLDLATTGYWIDRPYASGVNTFDYDPVMFPDAKAMIAKMHALGIRTALWHTPYIDEKDPATATLLAEAQQKGYFPPKRGILFNKWGTPIDFTNPDAYAWWQSQVKKYVDMGVQGFKLDYAEDIVPGVFGGRNVWEFFDGSDERTMHSQYQLLYHRVYAELLPDEENFLLCRGGTYGDQKYVSVVWPGDLDANFAKHGETVNDASGKYNAVGGLPAALIAALSLGPSGYPFYGSDTGGYRHSPPDKETFTRWFQVTALSTVMQIGTSTNDVAWEPTAQNGFDAEMLNWYRAYTRLHLRLFPYLWTYAKRLSDDGRPIQRALGLAHPELGVHPSDVFLLGDHLLVAPIVERGATSRQVPLPAGKFVHFFDGAPVDGGQTITANAALSELPLYLAAGGIVPLLRPTIDSMSPTTDPARVDSFATTPGELWAVTTPGPKTTFLLYDGTELSQEDVGADLKLSAKGGAEFALGVRFEVIGFGAAPKGVMIDGAAATPVADVAALDAVQSGWLFSAERGGTLWVKVPAGEHGVVVGR